MHLLPHGSALLLSGERKGYSASKTVRVRVHKVAAPPGTPMQRHFRSLWPLLLEPKNVCSGLLFAPHDPSARVSQRHGGLPIRSICAAGELTVGNVVSFPFRANRGEGPICQAHCVPVELPAVALVFLAAVIQPHHRVARIQLVDLSGVPGLAE